MLGRPTVIECMAQGQPKPLVSWSRQGETQQKLLSNVALRDLWGHSGLSIFVWSGNPAEAFFKSSVTSHKGKPQSWSAGRISDHNHLCVASFISPAVSRQLKLDTMTWTFLFSPPVSVWVEATQADLFVLSSVQMGSQFPLMWLSSRRTWWLGTQGAIMLASMSAGPTSPRPESLSSRLLSFTFLVWRCS